LEEQTWPPPNSMARVRGPEPVARVRAFLRSHPRASVAIGLSSAAALVVFLVLAVTRFGNHPDGGDASTSPLLTQAALECPSGTDAGVPCPPVGASPGPARSGPEGPFVAIVLVNDLRVRSEAGLSGAPVAVLQAGQVVWVTDGPVQADGSDWYGIQGGNNVGGWVSAGSPDQPYLDLRRPLPIDQPAIVSGLSGGPPGYLAWGYEAHRSDQAETPVVVVSSDGATWSRADLPSAMTDPIVSVAWGPAGWIAVATEVMTGQAGTFWRSDDGICWTSLPAFAFPSVSPGSVVGSSAGYALTAGDNRSGSTKPALFFSREGQGWNEVDPQAVIFGSGAVAMESGFLRWVDDGNGTHTRISADGQTWHDSGGALPGPWNNEPLFAAAGGWVVAVTTEYVASTDTVVQSVWRAQLGGSDLVWERVTDAEALLADNTIDSLASDGSTILAVGYEATNAELRMWRTSDGNTWDEVPAQGVFGGVPELVTGTGAGFSAVGGTVTLAGVNPVFWHATDVQRWTPERAPVLGRLVESPVVDECPGVPTTMVDWLVMPALVGVACFGDEPITFRAWLSMPGGCGGLSPGTYEPAWLIRPFDLSIIVTPFETPYGSCGSLAQHPTLTVLPDPQQWVMVTGHYDDPAAESCRWAPDPLYRFAVVRYGLVHACQQRFVTTAVVPENP